MEYKSEHFGAGGIEAKVVADSKYAGKRITTLELRYPRFIHAEFMTHRMFSRNASSSRAIPVKKVLDEVARYPAMPIHWGKNQPGMQADEENNTPIEFYDDYAVDGISFPPEEAWLAEAIHTSRVCRAWDKAGYHKQIVNRLTEPFQFIRVVCTATEWDNFFHLRLDKAAQPEIRELASCMKAALDTQDWKDLEEGQWHAPYVGNGYADNRTDLARSVARCARVSYKNHDKTDTTLEDDIRLSTMLYESGHWSPFEHQATPMDFEPWVIDLVGETIAMDRGVTHWDRNGVPWSGNFCEWIQYRQWLDQGDKE